MAAENNHEGDALLLALGAYLQWCFDTGASPRASELAARMGRSPAQLSRDYRASFGRGLAREIKARQIERAKQLLAWTDHSTNHVALAAGFGTQNTFFRVFQKATNMTPQRYRERARTSQEMIVVADALTALLCSASTEGGKAMKLTVQSQLEHKSFAQQEIVFAPSGIALTTLVPGGSTTCFGSSSTTTCCGIVQVHEDHLHV